jgi:hypothetical protein
MTSQSHLHPVQPPHNGDATDSARAPQRRRASRALPTDRMKMDVQVRVLHAIGRLSGAGKRPVTAQELGKAVDGLAATTVMLSNKFFADAGWIENQHGRYTATDALVEYSRRRALAGSGPVPSEAMEALRRPVRQSWFWQALRPYLANGRLPSTEAAIVLMSEAGAGESHKPMIANLIAWLRIIGLVDLQGDDISLAEGEPELSADSSDHAGPQADRQPGAPVAVPRPAATEATGEKPAAQAGGSPPAHVIAFNFGVRMTADDLARLTPEQIKSFFEAVGTVMALSKTKD